MRELLWRIILLTSRQQEKEGLRSRKAHKGCLPVQCCFGYFIF
jgi:hypothetical protein